MKNYLLSIVSIVVISFNAHANSKEMIATSNSGVGPILLGAPEQSLHGIALKFDNVTSFEKDPKTEKYSDVNGDGKISLNYYNYYSLGFSVLAIENTIHTIFFFNGARAGYETGRFKAFEGKLPFGLQFGMALKEIDRKLGKPSTQGSFRYAPVPTKWSSYDSHGLGLDVLISDETLTSVRMSLILTEKK